jgi:hypothetical protein
MQGTVERLNRGNGTGVILGEDGRDYQLDVGSLRGIAIEDVKLGMRVEFQPRSHNALVDEVEVSGMHEAPKPGTPVEAAKEEGVPADQAVPSIVRRDEVAEASWESFPASDSPANSGTT